MTLDDLRRIAASMPDPPPRMPVILCDDTGYAELMATFEPATKPFDPLAGTPISIIRTPYINGVKCVPAEVLDRPSLNDLPFINEPYKPETKYKPWGLPWLRTYRS